ncbi:MAG: ABC transporter permease [Melioribacteraceae bacterium]|nr:ABC transporter permease [Melioribacteraceae bacterium]MCF8354237.1 ABC transporter permease [Melioribacteraceae bacterium]MCF8394732.1 ABC transporter permease [Melioribacteraceae bacterium]MCF8417968.1 ABC transporter permease [Melioribacteraceae bacterium]
MLSNIWTITKGTFREALAKKIFLVFFGVSTFVLLIFILLFSFLKIEEFLPVINGQKEGETLNLIKQISLFFKMIVVVPLFGGGIFLSIFAVSNFIPNLLEKGNVDLFLSKPIARYQILLGKYLGGLIVVFLNIAYIVLGVWLLIGFKFGNWEFGFLSSILTITYTFALLYAFIIFIGVVTRSSILAMMISYLIFFIFSPLLLARDKISILIDSKPVEYILDGLYYLLPRTSELGAITGSLAESGSIPNWEPVFTSFGFMILSLLGAITIFSKKDY